MRITAAQMEALRRSADHAWIGTLCEHLRAHHPEAVAPFEDGQLREEVHRGVARARAHGLSARSRVTLFVALLFEIGPFFDAHPRIRRLLSRGRLSADARLDRLASAVSDEEWEEASRIQTCNIPGAGEQEA